MNPESSTNDPNKEQPDQPAGQVFTPGLPLQPPPAANSLTSTQPVMSASSMQSEQEKKKKGFRPSKKLALTGLVPLLLAGSGAAAYFGYIVPNKPDNVWRTALTNTGKGYDKISTYATSKKDVKAFSANGSFKVSGSTAADGAFKGESDGKSGQLTGSISAAGLKVNYDMRAIESPGNSPDIYFKLDGIQGLGDLVGGYAGLLGADSSKASKALNGLNGQWYFIDHSLFDQYAKGNNGDLQISSADVSQVLKAFGDSSKQFLFTDDPDKMAVVVKQYVGKEKQDGRDVYHYKVGVNKENLKAYNKSLCDNLLKTKLIKLFENGGSGDQDLSQQCYDTADIDKIKNGQTADAWVDLRTKLIHKIRIAEPKNANNYTDIIQDYQGGDEFPFSLGFHTQESVDSGINKLSSSKPETSTGLISMKLNMKTNTFSADANYATTGTSADKGNFKIIIAPSNDQVKIEKPSSSKTIIELMNDLGLGSFADKSAQTAPKPATN
jgi:hypothetical protein